MISKSKLQEFDIRTVVLVGGRDFGRYPLGARLPVSLWPIAESPALLRLLDHLAQEGIERAVVCCGRDIAGQVQAVCRDSRLRTSLVTEELISGTGGCLRDAATSDPGDLILVLSAGMAAPPPMKGLIEAHRSSGADMTVVFNPGRPEKTSPGSPAEIFLCRPQVLGHIPCGGYADIKEGVIPAILRAGGTVRPLVLGRDVGNFRDRKEYLDAIDAFLQGGGLDVPGCGTGERGEKDSVLKGVDARVHPQARICGPVLIGDRAQVLQGAVVIGPAMIGQEAVVGEDSVMVRGVLWTGAVVGARCEIRESVVDRHVTVPDGTEVVGQAVSRDLSDRGSETGRVRMRVERVAGRAKSHLDSWIAGLAEWMQLPPKRVAALLGGAMVLIVFLWSHWPTVVDLAGVWQGSKEYSSGLLVPFLSVYVVWSRRQEIGSISIRPAMLWGMGALLFAQAVRGAGLYFMFQSAERLSIILTVGALVLLILGWRCLVKLTPVLVFLCLMFPLPNRVHAALALPLQEWATGSAVFCLELVGCEVVRDGNLITLGDVTVGVAEACNGLRMITAFFVISGLVVLLARRPWWEKLIVLASSLPIALLCNTVRLAVTALLYTVIRDETWRQRLHDWDGYAMMPLALGMIVGELWLLAQLTTPPAQIEPAVISRRQPQQVSDPQ